MDLRVLGARVLVLPTVTSDETSSGLVLVDRHRDDMIFTGMVLAVGRPMCPQCGEDTKQAIADAGVRVGSKVGYEPMSGQKIDVNGTELIMLWIESLIFVADPDAEVECQTSVADVAAAQSHAAREASVRR